MSNVKQKGRQKNIVKGKGTITRGNTGLGTGPVGNAADQEKGIFTRLLEKIGIKKDEEK